jgi:hypothetical protein
MIFFGKPVSTFPDHALVRNGIVRRKGAPALEGRRTSH